MNDQRYKWRVKHKPGEKNKFSDHFVLWKYTWRLAVITDLRKHEETEGNGHMVFLEYFGNLPFDVFTRYTLHIVYADEEEETHELVFSFDEYQSDFGTMIKPKETKKITVEIETAARNYEMKKITPYAGMINLGSTCYINSFMQTLFHIRGFDRELFKQPPTNKTLEMQRLFFQLKQGHHYIDTLSFVKAFKLKEAIEYQQDIQEFAKYLLDELEKEAKGSPFFKYIEDTFYGEMACSLECAKGCKKEKTEKYNDIQLVISSLYSSESHGTLEEALSAYTTTTRLEYPNQYACSEHGYVDAEKKDYFKTFPPVLFFQIKRFGMDYETGETYKLNDRFSFPEEIDLQPFLCVEGDRVGSDRVSDNKGDTVHDVNGEVNGSSGTNGEISGNTVHDTVSEVSGNTSDTVNGDVNVESITESTNTTPNTNTPNTTNSTPLTNTPTTTPLTNTPNTTPTTTPLTNTSPTSPLTTPSVNSTPPNSNPNTTPHEYSLYSVNVHLGDGNTEGHYYAYIKKGKMWYKFNDCYVTPSSHQEAVEGTFGGRHIYKNKQNIANAYLLVYVRKSQMESLFSEAPIEVPEETREVIQGDTRMQQLVLHSPDTLCGYWGLGPFDASSVVPCAGSGMKREDQGTRSDQDDQNDVQGTQNDQSDQGVSGISDSVTGDVTGDNGKEIEGKKQVEHTGIQSRFFAFAEAYRPCSAPIARHYALQVDSRSQSLLSARSIREKGRNMLGRKKTVIFFLISADSEGKIQVTDITHELDLAITTDSEIGVSGVSNVTGVKGNTRVRNRTMHVIVVPFEATEDQDASNGDGDNGNGDSGNGITSNGNISNGITSNGNISNSDPNTSNPNSSTSNPNPSNPNPSQPKHFLLFFKAHKVMGQPHGLGAFCPVESVEVVRADELVGSWIQRKGLERDTVFAEKNGKPWEIPDGVTFDQLFQSTYGVLIAHAGLSVLEAYFRDLKTHQVVCVLTDFGVLRFWMEQGNPKGSLTDNLNDSSKNSLTDNLKEILAAKVHGSDFSLSACASPHMFVLEPNRGFGMIRYRYLGSATDNPNKEITDQSGLFDLLEDYEDDQQDTAVLCIVKQPFRGKEVLQVLAADHKKRAKREKVKVVETVSGDSVFRIFSIDKSFELRRGALITLQSVSTKRHVEASVKIGRHLVGHPFLVEIEPPITPEELKVKHRLQNSVLLLEKENGIEIQLDETQTIPKESLKFKLVFRITQ